MARINKTPTYGDSSQSDMEALHSLYMQVQQPQQAFDQWPNNMQARSYPAQMQSQQQQWPNMQQPRSKTPPPYPAQMQAFNMQQPRSKTPPPYPAQLQPQQAFNMQQPRSKTPPPYPAQVQPQQAFNMQQPRSTTPPSYPSQSQQGFDQWPNMQQPPYPPSYSQQPQRVFDQWPNIQQPSPYPPQMQQPQQNFDQWSNTEPPPPYSSYQPATARPPPPTKVASAIVPEPSAIASSSSSGPRQLVHSTLTEPVSATLARDIKRVAHNLRQIVVPNPNRVDPARALREWDLWGPFFFIICLSCILSSTASSNKSTVFAVVFAVLSAGAVSLTMNVVLLGGKLNFLQSLSVLGYCLFPLDVGAILCLARNNKIYRSLIVLITLLWSSWSVYPFVSTAVRQSRKALAVYPVFLMYISMGFLVLANG